MIGALPHHWTVMAELLNVLVYQVSLAFAGSDEVNEGVHAKACCLVLPL
jgi:hypothetical protein